MPFMMSLACIRMRLTPAEAINVCTINVAYVLGLLSTRGSIT